MGSVCFSLIGADCEEFLNALFKSGINVSKIRNEANIIYGTMKTAHYMRAARFTRQYSVRMRVKRKSRSYLISEKYKHRYGIFAGFIFAMLIITVLTSFVWDIDISGNEIVSDAQIAEILETHGIKKGVYIYSFENKLTELNTLLKLDELSWISIERYGSRVTVKTSERIPEETPDVPISSPCNIIASRSGQIVEVQVYSGTLMYKTGSGVAQGSLLVSGVVNDGGGKITYQHASAKIIAEYTVNETFFVPFESTASIPTQNRQEKKYLQILGFEIALNDENIGFPSFTYTEEVNKCDFLGIPLPFRIKTGTYTENVRQTYTLSEEAALKKLQETEENYRRNFLSDAEIISDELTYKPQSDGIILEAVYVVRSDIAVKQEISTEKGVEKTDG